VLADGELKARVEVVDDVVRVSWKPAAPRRESQGGEEERGGSAMRSRRNLHRDQAMG